MQGSRCSGATTPWSRRHSPPRPCVVQVVAVAAVAVPTQPVAVAVAQPAVAVAQPAVAVAQPAVAVATATVVNPLTME